MKKKIKIFDIKIDEDLLNFINNEIFIDLDIDTQNFWKGFSNLINEFNPMNKNLLNKRNFLQDKINEWHEIRKKTMGY